MFTFINASIIFAFGLVITGIVFLGVLQAREEAERAAAVEAAKHKDRPDLRRFA
jgi:hypothetical protein